MMNFVFIGILIISFMIIVYSSIKTVGTPKKNMNERIKVLEEEVESFGGKMISATKSKRIDCPYNTEFDDEDGSLYIPYRIKYLLDDKVNEGWAILCIHQSLLYKTGSPNEEWIWRL